MKIVQRSFLSLALLVCSPIAYSMQKVLNGSSEAPVADSAVAIPQTEVATAGKPQTEFQRICAMKGKERAAAFKKFQREQELEQFAFRIEQLFAEFCRNNKKISDDNENKERFANAILSLRDASCQKQISRLKELAPLPEKFLRSVHADWLVDVQQVLVDTIAAHQDDYMLQIAIFLNGYRGSRASDVQDLFSHPRVSIERMITCKDTIITTLCAIEQNAPVFNKQTPEAEVQKWFETKFSESLDKDRELKKEFGRVLDAFAAQFYIQIFLSGSDLVIKDALAVSISKMENFSEAELKFAHALQAKLLEKPEACERITESVRHWLSLTNDLFFDME